MSSRKHDKADVINYDEFNQLIDHTDFHHDPPPLEVIPQDENNNQAEETLMGMEYDFDTESSSEEYDEDEEVDEDYADDEYEEELAMELSEDDEDYDIGDLEYEDDGEDYEGDLEADARKNQKEHRV